MAFCCLFLFNKFSVHAYRSILVIYIVVDNTLKPYECFFKCSVISLTFCHMMPILMYLEFFSILNEYPYFIKY